MLAAQHMSKRPPLVTRDTLPTLMRLWREWVRPHWGTLAVVLLLIAVVSAATGAYPLLIKEAFNAFEQKNEEALLLGPVLVIVLTAIRGGALWGRAVLTNKVVTRVEADMQSARSSSAISAW